MFGTRIAGFAVSSANIKNKTARKISARLKIKEQTYKRRLNEEANGLAILWSRSSMMSSEFGNPKLVLKKIPVQLILDHGCYVIL